uniref:receptor protein-tyrosine kinase n=1 Tax=Myoviridae sp. ctgpD8 TaxID=2825149 RepID=A0A8S5QHK2_9CAUD|nr:MAG TPA: Glycine rich protein [Myoviridae sp. ctgpD8]
MNIDWISITPQSGAAGTSPVSFQLIAENDGFEDKTIKVRAVCGDKEAVKTLVLKGKIYPVGTVFNFDYTGTVQEVTLPAGQYKLQCWGAQGGNSGSYSGTGSKGGYSEGQLTLTEPTTLYIFVGGKGASSGNGGWNGGGGSTGSSSYDSGGTYGKSYPACGGGATDIATVTSDMAYSSKRNNRSAASLLSRCIVAGGGAGASARYTEETKTSTSDILYNNYSANSYDPDSSGYYCGNYLPTTAGETYSISNVSSPSGSSYYYAMIEVYYNGTSMSGSTVTIPSGATTVAVRIRYKTKPSGITSWSIYKKEAITSTDTSSGSSNSSQQGGGTSGRGTSPGTQNGGGGEFGKGKNQTATNYRYASGAGGGGWYGGGCSNSDSSTSQINASGGGSGFVNTAANAGYRPSGYTGLQLDSGETKAGNVSFPSPSGSSETGHSGNGYARITVL